MNIKEMSIEQLKALAYDHVCNMNNSQNSLNMINQEIASRNSAGVVAENAK